MIGAASPERQQRNCRALASVLADVRVEELAGLGHVAHNADPDRVAEAIGSFVG